MDSPAPGRALRTGLLLLLLLCLGLGARWQLGDFLSADRIDPFFTVESAQHFRYVRMVAAAGSVPALDLPLEWPDGAPTGEDTLFHEYLLGYLYRWLVPAAFPLDRFCRLAVVLAAALLPLLVFAILRGQGVAGGTSFLLAAAVAVNFGLVERSCGTLLYHEHFALPFILLHLLLLWRVLFHPGGGRWRTAIPAGVCLALALYAWKASTFYYQLHLLVLAAFLLAQRDPQRFVPAVRRYLLAAGFALAAVGLGADHLRAERFLLSVPFIVHAGWAFIFIEWGKKLVARKALLLALLIGPVVLLPAELPNLLAAGGTYSHVWAVVAAELKFGFAHPADPALLTPLARLYWVPPYTTPAPLRFLFDTAAPVLAALLALGFGWRRLRFEPPFQFALLWALVTGAAYLFFFKTVTFFVPALLVFVGVAGGRLLTPRAATATAALLLLAALVPYAAGRVGLVDALDRIGIRAEAVAPAGSVADGNDLVAWFADPARAGAPVLAHYGLGSTILAYADRPIVLQCYFETARVRDKVLGFAAALFGTEDEFAAFAGRYGARYFVYSADMLLATDPTSYRYLAAVRDPAGSVAESFHFRPERLRRFRLVHQTGFHRVYELLAATATDTLAALPGRVPLPFRPGLYAQFVRETAAAGPAAPGASDRFLVAATGAEKAAAVARVLAEHGAPEFARTFLDATLTPCFRAAVSADN